MKKIITAICLILLSSVFSHTHAESIIDEIKERGQLNCGIYDSGTNGQSDNIETLMCSIVAKAILNDETAVSFIPLIDDARWDALNAKAVDILYASPTWTLTRDINLGINFAPVHMFDTQLLLTLKSYNISSVKDISDDFNVCIVNNDTLVEPLQTFIETNNKKFNIIKLGSSKNVIRSLFHGKCEMVSEESDIAKTMLEKSDEVQPLDIVTMEPISAVTREGDIDLYRIASWTILGLIRAEEKGITSRNIDDILSKTKDSETLFMFGKKPGIGKKLKLNDDWLYQIVKRYGNYSEVLKQTIGSDSRIYMIQKKANSLYQDGGSLLSHPFY